MIYRWSNFCRIYFIVVFSDIKSRVFTNQRIHLVLFSKFIWPLNLSNNILFWMIMGLARYMLHIAIQFNDHVGTRMDTFGYACNGMRAAASPKFGPRSHLARVTSERVTGSDQSRLRDAVSSLYRSECVLLHPRQIPPNSGHRDTGQCRIMGVCTLHDNARLLSYISEEI